MTTIPRATAARFPAEYGQTPETIAELSRWDDVAALIGAASAPPFGSWGVHPMPAAPSPGVR
jgi:hypothetical protein